MQDSQIWKQTFNEQPPRASINSDFSYIPLKEQNHTTVIKRWSEAESFTIKVNLAYSHQKNLTFAHFLVTILALNLIQHVIAIGPIRNLDTGLFLRNIGDFFSLKFDSICNSYWAVQKSRYRLIFAHFLVTFLALELIQHLIAIGLIRNIDTGSLSHIFW